jgi:hypothetical protein
VIILARAEALDNFLQLLGRGQVAGRAEFEKRAEDWFRATSPQAESEATAT